MIPTRSDAPSNDNDQVTFETLYDTLNGLERVSDIAALLETFVRRFDTTPDTDERLTLMMPILVVTRLLRDRGGDPSPILAVPDKPKPN